MIEINKLTVSYGSKDVLAATDLAIADHETIAVIGPSGCGKSTLLYSIAGLIKPTSGSIMINGKSLLEPRMETSVILQDYGLLPWKNVYQNVALPLSIRGVAKSVIEDKVNALLNALHIEEQINKFPVQLSGGQQQRVAIARALIAEPDLLLMDEPFSALDATVREEMQDLILNLHQEHKLSLVFVTHSIEEAVILGKRIIVMQPNPGQIKRIITNPHFGDVKFRNEFAFHKLCVHVRQEMEGI
ncbi:NitT/TauT family transport system ATP-binding protein [Amphibacillus marinus]|uniref:NitT/TauT family transport system ATP-binding protein n=1 Tax=Amphibacillus marinus TaxID=872970 RepID=A0A1H8IH40_9BACI|nr:ABC transporter ATP-binding protein [Amphibacillus marinus]SEN67612.1 NitT/TauT family transport system ATP-binding protein [Amphibacillus marinus]